MSAPTQPKRKKKVPPGVVDSERDAPSPSMPEAAAFLRQAARLVKYPSLIDGLTEDQRERWRIRLAVIAACVEGTRRWRKSAALPLEQQNLLSVAADWVERRPRKESVNHALDRLAPEFADQMGIVSPEGIERVRDQIVEARKQASKLRRGK